MLATPLWIPETVMVVGATMLLIVWAGRDRRRADAAAMSETFDVVIVLVVFLGLLAAGMAIPFAIGVPAIAYLLLHGGVPALRESG